jgi:hypothetical protein
LERCLRVVKGLGERVVVRTQNATFQSTFGRSKNVLFVKDTPHEWLFPRCKLVMHHGGAGITGRILACGVPSIVIPHLQWADQSLWGEKVEGMGVGIHVQTSNPGMDTIETSIVNMLDDYGAYLGAAEKLGETIRTESETSLNATVELIETPVELWAPEVGLDAPERCPVHHSIARRKRASVAQEYRDFYVRHKNVALPEDPLQNKSCSACRFLIPMFYELFSILFTRIFLHFVVWWKRTVPGFRPNFPQSIETFCDPSNYWSKSLLSTMGILPGASGRTDAFAITSRPLAVDEGFTSSLFVCTETESSATFVLKMSPAWGISEQVTSIEQLQHTKEMWVGRRSRGEGGGMGCLVPYTWKSSVQNMTGEFLHVMEYLDGMVAGDQLSDLSLKQSLQAVGEIAKLHAFFWDRCPTDWNTSFDTLKYGRRIVAVLGKHYFNIQKGATTQFRFDPFMMGPLEHFLFSGPTTIVHGDLRSANVMFPANNGAKTARCCIIDWGGMMRGKGVFDVAYLLGTGMSEESRRLHELPILQHYYSELDANGANLMNYSFNELVRDYRICLWLTAALYAIPEIYDRGTLSEENETAAEQVRAQLRHNLQPILNEDVVYQKM